MLREILRRSRTLPGVEEAAVGDEAALPLGHSHPSPLPLIREGIETMDNQAPLIDSPIVSPEYFHLLGMPLVRGRLFSDQDLEDYAPGCSHQSGRGSHLLAKPGPAWQTRPFALGYPRAVELCQASLDHDRRRHCGCPHGIAGGRGNSADLPQRVPAPRQRPGHLSSRTTRSQRHLRTGARADPVRRCGHFPSSMRRPWMTCSPPRFPCRRFSMEMVALFAATALLLAGLGIYGTISYVVNEQTTRDRHSPRAGSSKRQYPQDGPAPGTRLWPPPAPGWVWPVRSSSLISWPDCSTACRLTICPPSPASPLVLTAVALAASYIPALRAMRLDPITTLHSE